MDNKWYCTMEFFPNLDGDEPKILLAILSFQMRAYQFTYLWQCLWVQWKNEKKNSRITTTTAAIIITLIANNVMAVITLFIPMTSIIQLYCSKHKIHILFCNYCRRFKESKPITDRPKYGIPNIFSIQCQSQITFLIAISYLNCI